MSKKKPVKMQSTMPVPADRAAKKPAVSPARHSSKAGSRDTAKVVAKMPKAKW